VRFFLDENEPPLVARSLEAVFGTEHEFVSAHDRPNEYREVDDVELIARIAEHGFHAIITQDRNQLLDTDERHALFQAGIHWIGHRMNGVPSLAGVALTSATVLAGIGHVLDIWHAEPYVYRLTGVPSEVGQRVKAMPVWNSALQRRS
jgi:hypothetical protein